MLVHMHLYKEVVQIQDTKVSKLSGVCLDILLFAQNVSFLVHIMFCGDNNVH